MASNIPTVSERGLPGFEYDTWYAMLAPAATASALVRQLHRDTEHVMRQPRIEQQLSQQGIAIVVSTPEALGEYLGAELKKWAAIIRTQLAKG